MKKPPRLRMGDRVHIVLPGSPVRMELLEKGIATLQGLGFNVTHGDVARRWRYLAGTDAQRREELVSALGDSEIRAIFFGRGGYGSLRLLTDVSELAFSYDPKVLLGCSDITTLHVFFQRMQNWVVFHGPMASGDVAKSQLHLDSFQQALMQNSPYRLAPPKVEVLKPGKAEGVLVGGCLSLLHSSFGTSWQPYWKQVILFLEDVATKPYQIDRMLTHLKILGKFDGVRAFIFGEMKDCVQVENQGYTLQEVIIDILDELGKPIFFGFPSGHVSGMNWTLPLGIQARVSSSPSFQLEFLEGAVE